MLKLPQKPVPAKVNASIPVSNQRASRKVKPRAESAPPTPAPTATKQDDKKGGKKGSGHGKGGKPVPKHSPSPANPTTPRPKAHLAPTATTGGERKPPPKQPGRIQIQCVPYTLPSGCHLGQSVHFYFWRGSPQRKMKEVSLKNGARKSVS